jgi:hypothetical protein
MHAVDRVAKMNLNFEVTFPNSLSPWQTHTIGNNFGANLNQFFDCLYVVLALMDATGCLFNANTL